MLGLYQVKAEFAGSGFACLRPVHTDGFYAIMQAIARAEEEGFDSPEWRAKKEQAETAWRRKLMTGQCGDLQIGAVMKRWDSDEKYPELIGVRRYSFGSTSGRTYWTRLDWLEPAQ